MTRDELLDHLNELGKRHNEIMLPAITHGRRVVVLTKKVDAHLEQEVNARNIVEMYRGLLEIVEEMMDAITAIGNDTILVGDMSKEILTATIAAVDLPQEVEP